MAAKSNELTRYSDDDLAVFETLINEKLAIAQEQLASYEAQITELGESEEAKFKSLGESTSQADNERLFDMVRRQKKLMHHLENAKLRIKNKVYGVCRDSGKLISKERLMAVPHATLSIEAKQRK